MDLWVREARLFKYGSGTGSNFSKVRGENESLSGGGKSSGLMSFLKIGDRAAGAIKSGGTTRRAAKMVIVDIDHPDIEETARGATLPSRDDAGDRARARTPRVDRAEPAGEAPLARLARRAGGDPWRRPLAPRPRSLNAHDAHVDGRAADGSSSFPSDGRNPRWAASRCMPALTGRWQRRCWGDRGGCPRRTRPKT